MQQLELDLIPPTGIANYGEAIARNRGCYDKTGRLVIRHLYETMDGLLETGGTSDRVMSGGGRGFTAILSQGVPRQDQRFAAVHLLGHRLLHWDEGTRTVTCKGMDLTVERQADLFALGALMPALEFRQVWDRYGADRCVQLFGVAVGMVEERARMLRDARQLALRLVS